MREHIDQQLLVDAVQELFIKHGCELEVTNVSPCFGGVINWVYFLDCFIQEEKGISEISLVLKIYCGKNVKHRLDQITKDFYVYNLLSHHLDQNTNHNNYTENNYVWAIENGYDNMAWYLKNRDAAAKSLFPFALLWNLGTTEPSNHDDIDVELFLSQYTLVIMTKVEGSPLNLVRRSDPSKKHHAYQQLGQLVSKMHEFKISDVFGVVQGKCVPVTYATNEAFVSQELQKALEDYKLNRGDSLVADRITSYFENNKTILNNCTNPCFCHNDIHEGNILINDSNISGLIDVEAALSGDPLCDLAKIFIFATKRDEVKELAFLEGYTAAKKLPHDAADRIYLYELLVAIQMWNFHASSEDIRQQTLSSVDRFIRDLLNGGCDSLQKLLNQFIA